MERVAGIEPAYTAWKAVVIAIIPYPQRMVVGGGFEPPKLTRQIYSLIPLAARESHPIILQQELVPARGVEPRTY
jgi:hypothetical protein